MLQGWAPGDMVDDDISSDMANISTLMLCLFWAYDLNYLYSYI